MRKHFLVLLLTGISFFSYSQDSTVVVTAKADTLAQLNSAVSDTLTGTDKQALLPEHYLFTQRLLWSEHGLMRNFDAFKLSQESRNLEMKIRSITMTAHEYLGYASLLGMIGTAVTGQKLYTGSSRNRDLHETFAGLTNVCYFSTAALGLFQPPPMYNREAGFTKLRIHRTLSIIHLTSMIATNVLSGMMEHNEKLRPYHKAAAITAFSSLFLATVVIKL